MKEQFGEDFELAVSVKTQQAAALYGVATGLLSMGNIPNKKGIKRVVKLLRGLVIQDIGHSKGAREILAQNSGAISMAIAGIRKDPSIEEVARKKMISLVKEDLLDVYQTGVKKLGIVVEE